MEKMQFLGLNKIRNSVLKQLENNICCSNGYSVHNSDDFGYLEGVSIVGADFKKCLE